MTVKYVKNYTFIQCFPNKFNNNKIFKQIKLKIYKKYNNKYKINNKKFNNISLMKV